MNQRYLITGCSLLALVVLGLSLLTPVQAETPKNTAKRETSKVSTRIDAIINKALEEAKVPASGMSDDAEFARRLSLDLRGRIPTPDRVTRFLADKDPNKRAKLIEDFLDDPEYGEHFAIIWYHRLVKRTMDDVHHLQHL